MRHALRCLAFCAILPLAAQSPVRVDGANLAASENIYSTYPFSKPVAMTKDGALWVLGQFNTSSGTSELRIYRSTDGGATFALETKGRTSGSGLGSLVVGEDGTTLHVAFGVYNSVPVASVYYARYDTRARAWQGNDQVLFLGGATTNDGYLWPNLDIGADGNPVVVCTTHRNRSWSAQMRFFDGTSWSAEIPINVDIYGVFVNVVADRRGDYHFVYRTNTGGYGIRYRRYDRAAQAFGSEGEIQVFAGTANCAAFVMDDAGGKYVLYSKDQSLELAAAPPQSNVFTSTTVCSDATYAKGNLNYFNFAIAQTQGVLWVCYSYPSRNLDEIFGRLWVAGTLLPEVSLVKQSGRKYEWMSAYGRPTHPLGRVLLFTSEDTGAGIRELFSLADGAGFVPIGAGCAGGGGFVPFAGASSLPNVGSQSFALRVGWAKGGAAVLALLGTRDDSFGGIPLPFDLTPLKMPGCFLRNDVVVQLGAVASGSNPGEGEASIPAPIPNNPTLIGIKLFCQWLVVDPAANAAGLSTSGSGAVIIR